MNDYANRGDLVLSPVQTHATRLNVQSGQGAYLHTTDGQRILDFACGIAVTNTGHCHPDVVAAIQTQAQHLIHACSGVVYYEPHIQLAEQLRRCLDWSDAQFFFTQSGAESIEAALKLAKYVSKKTRILAFKGGFHGRTLGALSITSSKASYQSGYEPLLPQVDFIDYPYRYHRPDDQSDAAYLDGLIDQITEYFERYHAGLAAVVIEPILGEGGYVPAPLVVLEKLRQLCDRYGVFLIFDEIQSGIGRTGHWFAFQHFGVEPDIVTIAKGVASGMPLGAVVAREAIMSQWSAGAHGGTFSGNPVCAAAAIATIDVIESVLPRVHSLSSVAMSFLTERLADHPHVGEIRGVGLMIGIELVLDTQTRAPNPDLVKSVLADCLANQVLVVSCGVRSNVIRLMPPLIIDEDTLLSGLTVLCDALKRYRS